MVRLPASRFTFLSNLPGKGAKRSRRHSIGLKGSTSLVHVIQKPAESAFLNWILKVSVCTWLSRSLILCRMARVHKIPRLMPTVQSSRQGGRESEKTCTVASFWGNFRRWSWGMLGGFCVSIFKYTYIHTYMVSWLYISSYTYIYGSIIRCYICSIPGLQLEMLSSLLRVWHPNPQKKNMCCALNPQGSHLAVTPEDPVLAALADGIGAQEPESLVAQLGAVNVANSVGLGSRFSFIDSFLSNDTERCRAIQVIHGNQGRHFKFVGDLRTIWLAIIDS